MVRLSHITNYQSDLRKKKSCWTVAKLNDDMIQYSWEKIHLNGWCTEEEMVVGREEKLRQSTDMEEIDTWLETECKEKAPDRAWTWAANLWFNRPPPPHPNSQFTPWWNLLDQQKQKVGEYKDKRYARQRPLHSCFCCCLLLFPLRLLGVVSHQLVWRRLLNGIAAAMFQARFFGTSQWRGVGDTVRQERWGLMWDKLTSKRRH